MRWCQKRPSGAIALTSTAVALRTAEPTKPAQPSLGALKVASMIATSSFWFLKRLPASRQSKGHAVPKVTAALTADRTQRTDLKSRPYRPVPPSTARYVAKSADPHRIAPLERFAPAARTLHLAVLHVASRSVACGMREHCIALQ